MDQPRKAYNGERLIITGYPGGKHVATIEKRGYDNPICTFCTGIIKPDIDRMLERGISLYFPPRGNLNSPRWIKPDNDLFLYLLGIYFVKYSGKDLGYHIRFEHFWLDENGEPKDIT